MMLTVALVAALVQPCRAPAAAASTTTVASVKTIDKGDRSNMRPMAGRSR